MWIMSFCPFFSILLLILSSSLASVTVEKCCPEDRVLDSSLNSCVSFSSKSEILTRFAANSCPEDGSCLDFDTSGFLRFGSSRLCPVTKRLEHKLKGWTRHGKLILEIPDGNNSSRIRKLHPGSGICSDMALNRNGELEGPFTYSCLDDMKMSNNEGYIVKCCRGNLSINGTCLPPDSKAPHFFPRRIVQHPVTGASTRIYHVRYHDDPSSSTPSCFFQEPNSIFTDGRVKLNNAISAYECVDYVQTDTIDLMALICPPYISTTLPETTTDRKLSTCSRTSGRICVSKCCETEEIFDFSASRCVRSPISSLLFRPEFRSLDGSLYPGFEDIEYNEFWLNHLLSSECLELYKVDPGETIYLLKNESNSALFHEGYDIIDSGFCVDNFASDGNGSGLHFSAFKCVNSPQKRNSCGYEEMGYFNVTLRYVYTACGVCSLWFLVITLFLYSTLPNFKNLHGKIVISNIVAIFLTTLFLIVVYNSTRTAGLWCVSIGYSLYYSGLAMFCWMSVMCVDLCWTFVRAKIPRKGSDRLKFAFYSAFAWIVPVLLCIVIGILDYTSTEFAPKVGQENCFLSMRGARHFFYIPILILLCFNALMYLITIVTLWRSQRYSKKAGLTRISVQTGGHLHYNSKEKSKKYSSHHIQSERGFNRINSEIREQLLLFTKLFLIMGLSWISECIHVEIHGDHQDLKICNFYLEVFLRIIGGLNMLRGFGFFVIFICKKSVFESFKKTHPYLIRKFLCCISTKPSSSPSSSQPQRCRQIKMSKIQKGNHHTAKSPQSPRKSTATFELNDVNLIVSIDNER